MTTPTEQSQSFVQSKDRVSIVGLPVSWREEQYRVHFKNRPIVFGTVVAVDENILTVKRDDDDRELKGHWACFTPLWIHEAQVEMGLI